MNPTMLCVQRRYVDVHAGTRLDHVDHNQADDQRQGRDDFEVQQGIATGLADRLHALHPGDAADHGTEDDRGDDHLDQLDEAVAEWLELDRELRIEVADQNTDDDRDDHLEIQRFVQWLTSRHCKFLKCIAWHSFRSVRDT
jgi:hypothetical protein